LLARWQEPSLNDGFGTKPAREIYGPSGVAAKNLTKKLPNLRLVDQQGGLYAGFPKIGRSFNVVFGAPTAKTLG
jgi:hypothetical protein